MFIAFLPAGYSAFMTMWLGLSWGDLPHLDPQPRFEGAIRDILGYSVALLPVYWLCALLVALIVPKRLLLISILMLTTGLIFPLCAGVITNIHLRLHPFDASYLGEWV